MKNYKLYTSNGVRDYMGDEVLIKDKIETKIKKLFLSYGYELVHTPTFEYVDLYTNNTIQKPSLYKFINQEGEVVALRNDMTASIARVVATKDNSNVIPKKYCYVENTFRYPRMYQGKSHEFTQAGIELIGSDSIKSVIECIKLANRSLLINNITNFTIHIGNCAFIEAMFDDFNFNDELKKILLVDIANKDFVALENKLVESKLDKKYIDLVLRLMTEAGKLNFLNSIKDSLGDLKCKSILEDLENTYQRILKISNLNTVIFDFSIYSYANYYTGLIFKIFVNGIEKAVVDGGRYDSYYKENYDLDYKAIGFGLHINSLVKYAMDNHLVEVEHVKYISMAEPESYEYAVELNDMLRSKGIIIDVSMYNTKEETMAYAKMKHYNKFLYYKNNKQEKIDIEAGDVNE